MSSAPVLTDLFQLRCKAHELNKLTTGKYYQDHQISWDNVRISRATRLESHTDPSSSSSLQREKEFNAVIEGFEAKINSLTTELQAVKLDLLHARVLATTREQSILETQSALTTVNKHEKTIKTQNQTITQLQKNLREAVMTGMNAENSKQKVSSDGAWLEAGADIVSGVVVDYHPGEDSQRARHLYLRIVLRPNRRRPGHRRDRLQCSHRE